MAQPESLSVEELRGRLYQNLREKGLVDSLKSQLRNKLVSELKSHGLSQSLHYQPVTDTDHSSLLQRAANSLVADHLKRCNYDYSLSVFVPETGNNADKLFTMKELMQLLHISPESRLYKSLLTHSREYHSRGFLWQLLTEIAQQHGYSSHHTGVQTEPVSLPPLGSIEEEFKKLDRHYSSLSEEYKSKMVIEERLLSYQRQLEERGRTEIQLECSRFKENELARMRMEEREKCRKEIDKSRKEVERTYRAKLDALSERERVSTDKLQLAQQMYEKETYAQRQSVLEEIEAVRQRETNLHRQEQIDKREQGLWEDKLKLREEQAKKREDSARKIEVECQQKIKDNVDRFKIEEQSRYLEWNKSLEIREARVKENERRLHDDMFDIQQVKDELREKRNKLSSTEVELTKTRHDLISYQKQTEVLGEKHRQMLDYEVVKEENAILRRESENLKTRIAELTRDITVERQKHEELLREMGHINQMPTSETFMLKKQVNKLQTELRQEKAVGDHQTAQRERRYQDEVDRNRELMRKYEEQTLQQREMIKEMNDMRQLLQQHRVALNNEVYRKPKHSFLEKSDSLCDIDDLVGDVGPSPLRASHETERVLAEALSENKSTDEYSYSSDLVKETKRRLQGLEKEAVNLEQNYRNFQFRLSSVGAPVEEPVTITPSKTRVTFQRDIGFSHLADTQRSQHTPQKLASDYNDRPFSSSPSRVTPPRISSTVREGYTPPPVHSRPTQGLDESVSTIRSGTPPLQEREGPVEAAVRHRPMSVTDLQARPGSPSVVVLPGSDASQSADKRLKPRGSPSGEEGTDDKTEGGVKSLSLDDAWKQQNQAAASLDDAWKQQNQAAASLDDAWKQKQNVDVDRQTREAEQLAYEQQRRDRENERRKKESEAWEREQRALRELEGQKQEPEPEAEKSAAESSKGPAIDPVMQKYMEMVQQQKEKEKQITKKSVDTWSKGKSFSHDKTPSHSEISAADTEEEEKSVGPSKDDDFW